MKKVSALKILGTAVALSATVALNGCSSDSVTAPSIITLSGTLASTTAYQLRAGIHAMATIDPTVYRVNCLTFDASPTVGTSDVAATGAFSLQMPANTMLGCFLIDKTSMLPKASFVIKKEAATMGQDGLANYGFKSDVDFGTLTVDLESGIIEIPESVVTGKTADGDAASMTAILEDMHNHTYTFECVSTGIAQQDAQCAAFIAEPDNAQAFIRVLKGTDAAGAEMHGMAVWASQEGFTACGSKDISAAPSDITFAEGWANVGAFTFGGACPKRNPNSSDISEGNVRYMHAIGPVTFMADGFSLAINNHQTWTWNDGTEHTCERSEQTTVAFKPINSDASEFYGQFSSHEFMSGDGCDESGATDANFMLKFTRQ